MTFDELLEQILALLQRQGRVSYGALKRRFALDDAYLQDIKDELIIAQQVATDENGKVLVWVGKELEDETAKGGTGKEDTHESRKGARENKGDPAKRENGQKEGVRAQPPALSTKPPAERRQLTVMFCNLAEAEELVVQLDPEELQTVVRSYQETCAQIIQHYDGYIAQYLDDGVLVYFGYPVAHEDDARRAVQAGLDIVAALQERNTEDSTQSSLQVRLGIHTGLVVIGEIGGGSRREQLALGETPNVASRLQELAAPGTIVISAATMRLVQGYFLVEDCGFHLLKGLPSPMRVYQVLQASGFQSRLQIGRTTGLTPLVGRTEEVQVLRKRWEQAKTGTGQIVFVSGEAGIGKSRLLYALKAALADEPYARLEGRCSPYHQHSALFPVIDVLPRVAGWTREDSVESKRRKLERTLALYSLPQDEILPFLGTLLSLPLPEYSTVTDLPPAQRKKKTLTALVRMVLAVAQHQPLLITLEDLHWIDPSTLDLLNVLVEQIPTSRILAVFTSRLEMTLPWPARSHMTMLTLSRLDPEQAETMISVVTKASPLPPPVVQQIVTQTDGVPLFIEELTKMLLETTTPLTDTESSLALPLEIPVTLQDSLMARLDRLGSAKEVAQLAATLGREFSFDLLHAVSRHGENDLQQTLAQLVNAELLYQSGFPPQITYVFSHALVREAAYQSLLKSQRQTYHQQIARTLETQFPEIIASQPELVAHHYTDAGLAEQAIPYWQTAGQQAAQRSANIEAIRHFTKGLDLVQTLPLTPERIRQELDMRVALSGPLIATKGYAASEVEETYARAYDLSQHTGEAPDLAPVLLGLMTFYTVRAKLRSAIPLGQQLLMVAERTQSRALQLAAHTAYAVPLLWSGEVTHAYTHCERGRALYDPQHDRPHLGLQDFGVTALCYSAFVSWILGYPTQAQKQITEAIRLSRQLDHPFNLAWTHNWAARLHLCLGQSQETQQQADALHQLSHEQNFSQFIAHATILRGWVLTHQGNVTTGIKGLRQGLTALRETGAELGRPWFLGLLAESYGKLGETEEARRAVIEALALVQETGEHLYEAELYRLKGELTLQSSGQRLASGVPSAQHPTPSTQTEAEGYFHKAIGIAQTQQAKSWELRAATSLARLWQQQGKRHEARDTLSAIYVWFTEGFDTTDMRNAKA
ncbi:MAG: adenylate/guanylate cyclase domain-containing protein, partial [Candidatus Binatia bacterium]